MTISEAATYLGVTRKVIYRLLRDGELHRQRDPFLQGGPEKLSRAEVEAVHAKARQLRESREPYRA